MSKTTLAGVLTAVGAVITFVLFGIQNGTFTDPTAISLLLTVLAGAFGITKSEAKQG